MVKIRLKRFGAVKHAKFRLVVIDSRSRRDGRVIEEIGYYDPQANPAIVTVSEDAAIKWLKSGAQPSDTVRTLLKQSGVMDKLGAAS